MYRYEAVSIAGFIQQLAVSYVANGYWFYVTGRIPAKKDPARTDEKIIQQYGCAVSKWVRARRKRAGHANVQYLRFGWFFVIIATSGKHSFFEAEAKCLRDVRETPIKFGGYAIGSRERGGVWHPSVRIEREYYRELRRRIFAMAVSRSPDDLVSLFWSLQFQPYAPIRQQLRMLLGAVNRRRAVSSLETLSSGVLQLTRRPVLPFGQGANAREAQGRRIEDYRSRGGACSAFERGQ